MHAPLPDNRGNDMVCELCGRPWQWEAREWVSYHDLMDLDRGVDVFGGGLKDVRLTFPRLQTYPKFWTDVKGPSDDWFACALCHHRVRRALGRSEYAPSHYSEFDTALLHKLEREAPPAKGLPPCSPSLARETQPRDSQSRETQPRESPPVAAPAEGPELSNLGAVALAFGIPLFLAVCGAVFGAWQWLLEWLTGWPLGPWFVTIHGAAVWGALLPSALILPLFWGDAKDKLLPLLAAAGLTTVGASLGLILGALGWLDPLLGSYRALHLPGALASGLGLASGGVAERAFCWAMAALIGFLPSCLVGAAVALTGSLKVSSVRLGSRIMLSLAIVAGIAGLFTFLVSNR